MITLLNIINGVAILILILLVAVPYFQDRRDRRKEKKITTNKVKKS